MHNSQPDRVDLFHDCDKELVVHATVQVVAVGIDVYVAYVLVQTVNNNNDIHNHYHNNRIYIAPYGRNFRGAVVSYTCPLFSFSCFK